MARTRGRAVLIGALVLLGLGAVFLWRGAGPKDGELAEKTGAGPARPSIFASEPGIDESLPPGAIEGEVLGPESKAIAGATVILTRVRDRNAPFSSEAGRPLAIQATDRAGRFRFQTVHAGSYSVSAMAEGFAPEQKTPIEVASGQTAETSLALEAGGFLISGRILDVGGGVVPGATVRAMGMRMMTSAGDSPPLAIAARSDDQGVYKLYVGRGQVGLHAEAEGYAPAFDWFMVSQPLTRDLRLSPAAQIVGRVVDGATGKPVPDAELWLITPRQGRMAPPRDVKSDQDGVFAFNALEPGSYRVGARKSRAVGLSAPVAVAPADTASNVEVPVHAGLVLSGKVRNAKGEPVEDAQLFLFKNQPPRERPMTARTGADGTFAFEGALPGQYALQARADGLAGAYRELRVVKDQTDLDVQLGGGGATLSGQILSAEGKPVENVTINVRVQPKNRAERGSFERVVTDAKGKFEVKGLAAGELNLTALHEQHGVASKEREPLAENEKKVLTLKLDTGASIAGTVRTDDGQPAVGARVGAMPRRGAGGSGQYMVATDDEGRYQIKGLPAGPVTVVASTGPGMRWGGSERPDQKNVTVADKEKMTGVDLIVPGAMNISGLVVGYDGKPISGAQISAAPEEQGRPNRAGFAAQRAFSDFDGRFTIERLGKGPHTVWAEQPGYADAQLDHVEAGKTDVKIVFPREATLGGVVTTRDGKPVPDYTIALVPGPKSGETPLDRQQRLRFSVWQSPTDVVHDPSGRFLFRAVNGGSHELRVTTADGNGGSQTVEIAEGEDKQDVRIVIDVGGKLIGQVVALEGGQPLPGIEVSAYATTSPGRTRQVLQTDPSGKFAIEGMPPGEQVMLFVRDPEDKHINERRQIELKPGGDHDLGTIALEAGNVRARVDEGTWQGLTGISNSQDDQGLVEMARPGTPAEKAGIKQGDKILAVDGKDVRGKSPGQLEWRLRGKPGSSVSVTVQAPGEAPRTVNLTRVDPMAGRAPPSTAPTTQKQAASASAPASGQTGRATPASATMPAKR